MFQETIVSENGLDYHIIYEDTEEGIVTHKISYGFKYILSEEKLNAVFGI